jgi:hypothetical protein
VRPDEYYKLVWVHKNLYDGIEFLAKVNRTSRMRVANDLLELGFSTFIAQQISEDNSRKFAVEQGGESYSPSSFILMMRRWAKKKGYDISKFV